MAESIRVLHVDDEPDFADMAADFLENEDDRLSVATASSANEGMDRLEAEDFDCIVSDFDMAGQNGLEFLQNVREEYPAIPFILFTGKGSEEVASEAISAGVTDYLQKDRGSIQYEVLANRITNAVDQFHSKQEFEKTNEVLEAVIEASPVAILSYDRDQRIQLWNAAAEEIYGWTAEEVMGEPLPMIPDGKEDELEGILDRVFDGESFTNLELKRETKSGEDIDISLSTAPLQNREGKVIGNVSVVQDITERKEREERLAEMTDRMQLALEGSDSWLWEWNVDTDVLTQSAVIGVNEETVTRPVDDFLEQLHPEDREVFLDAKDRAVAGEDGYYAEYRLIDGVEVRWIESKGQVYRGTSEEPDRVIGIARDVTAEKQRALERQWMLRALDQSREAVFVSDPGSGEIEFVNDTACEQIGYDRDELLEMTILDIQPALSTTEAWEEHVERLRSEGHTLFEGRHLRRDGTEIPVEVNTGLVEIERQEYLLGIARDITHRKERERELQRKIDRLDEFASIISHDLRNPLNVAAGQLNFVMKEVEHERLEVVDQSLNRMQTLIEDLLTMAREGNPTAELESVDLATLARTCWETADTGDATLRIETEGRVSADRSRLRQLFENLFRNAVVHAGDDVTVAVGDIGDGGGFFVEDDGPGIPAEDRERVFEPGYTTREGGTGFGLPIVEKIADAHGWDIHVTDGRDDGTRFEFSNVETVAE